MIIQYIYNSLSICVCVRLKIASHLTHLETKVTCSSLQTCVCIAETCLHLVNDVLLPKLILVAHLDNVLLRLAAAVLQCRCKISISEVNSVNNAFCREVNITCYFLNSRLNAANSTIQCVEITIQVRG